MKLTTLFAAASLCAALTCATYAQTYSPAPCEQTQATADQCVSAYVFTSPNCPACNAVKGDLQRVVTQGFCVQTIDPLTQSGAAVARAWGVRQIPTVIVVANGSEFERVSYYQMAQTGAFRAVVSALDRAKKKISRATAIIASEPFRAIENAANSRRVYVATAETDGRYTVRGITREPARAYIYSYRGYTSAYNSPTFNGYVVACDPVDGCTIDARADSVRPCDAVGEYDPDPVGACDSVASPYSCE